MLVNGKRVVMREGDVFVDGEVIMTCKFCGREYDHEEYVKTMSEQAPQRDPSYFKSTGTKYCGLYCAWLNDGAFTRRQLEKDQERVNKMKEDIAKRVSVYLKKKGGKLLTSHKSK